MYTLARPQATNHAKHRRRGPGRAGTEGERATRVCGQPVAGPATSARNVKLGGKPQKETGKAMGKSDPLGRL